MSLNRRLDPPVPLPVPAGYIRAKLHFSCRIQDFCTVFNTGDVVVRDRMPHRCAREGWTLRKVYVDPTRFDELRSALAVAGIGELRRSGHCRTGIEQAAMLTTEPDVAQTAYAGPRQLRYADAFA